MRFLTRDRHDAVGFSSRLIDELKSFTRIALNHTISKITLPTKVIYPQDLDLDWSKEQVALHAKFIAAIENVLAVKTEPISLAEVWADSPPAEADGQGMQEYMKDVSLSLVEDDHILTLKGILPLAVLRLLPRVCRLPCRLPGEIRPPAVCGGHSRIQMVRALHILKGQPS